MRYLMFAFLCGWVGVSANGAAPPNILLIAVDDLNDWVGCLGGHPQADTPHIDRLAQRGTLFRNAHCQAPVCQPSRASLMTSRFPASTGLYFLNPGISGSPENDGALTLPELFAEAGYAVSGAGKLFHHRDNVRIFGALEGYGGAFGGFGPRPKKKISQPHGHPLWDWGAYPERDAEMPDARLAAWAEEQLAKTHARPFLLCVGFHRPHVPMYVPPSWFERHPLAEVRLPETREDDPGDLSEYARNLTRLEHVAPKHAWVRESGQWPHAVRSYLASVSFVDACVGRVLDALDESAYAENTLVVLFSDHGFHLGEKERWAKRSLWEDGTRVPLVIAGPGVNGGRVCDRPVGLIDVFPTLLAMTERPPVDAHEGRSLLPLLEDHGAEWDHPALTTFGPGNHAVRSTRWRYIRYRDGSEELYDHAVDPHEWNNLAVMPGYEGIIAAHARWVPVEEAPVLGAGSTGHRAYAAAAAAQASETASSDDDAPR